jgi:hypothetical protein
LTIVCWLSVGKEGVVLVDAEVCRREAANGLAARRVDGEVDGDVARALVGGVHERQAQTTAACGDRGERGERDDGAVLHARSIGGIGVAV